MNKFTSVLIILAVTFGVCTAPAHARNVRYDYLNDYDDGGEKPFSLGVGWYGTVIAHEEDQLDNDEFYGHSLTVGYAFTDQLAIRLSSFDLEYDSNSDVNSSGYDILAHIGVNLMSPGFKAYVGGGYFRDKVESKGTFVTTSRTFSGVQLSGGLGYNWDSVSLDLVANLRQPNDYMDAIEESDPTLKSGVAVLSTSLIVSLRF